MRMSCNGCRVLRKGCSEDCSIRPCLQWIKSPESQAHATVFLAKFYGRAGLMNLINAGPEHLRPAIFRSLLYEACGRLVNPIYGSVGLLWSGSWQLCQAAVEAVLKGAPITPITSEAAASGRGPPLKPYDIRHVSKDENSAASTEAAQRVKTRSRFKRAAKTKSGKRTGSNPVDMENRSASNESSLSHPCKESESVVSVEGSILLHDEPESNPNPNLKEGDRAEERGGDEVGLELTLGFAPPSRSDHVIPVKKRRIELKDWSLSCKTELGLELAA